MNTRDMNIIATAAAGKSTIFIEKTTNRKTADPLFVVHIAHVPGYYITWAQSDSEAGARVHANKAWRRFSGREEMICA